MNTAPTNPPPLDTIVYSRSGHRAKYICSVTGRHGCEHYVKPEVEFGLPDGEVDSSFEGATVWHEYFLTPPREVIDKEIVALEARKEQLEIEVRKMTEEKRTAEKDVLDRKARLARHDQLKQLDDFITKGISCYVVDQKYSHDIEVIDFKSTSSAYSRTEFRLLSLFGRSNGDLSWRLNTYYDGSGSWSECIPCASKDDVPAAVAALLERVWTRWRKEGSVNLVKYANAARQYGLPVPEDVLAKIAADEEKAKKMALEEAEKAFVKAQKNLMKAREGIVDTTGVTAKPAPVAAVAKGAV